MAKQRYAIVILGASGDLAKRKLIPALARLFRQNIFDETTVIIGSGRSSFSHGEFRSRFGDLGDFTRLLYYHQGISGLKQFVDSQGNFDRCIFFMSLPPEVYASTAGSLYDEGFRDNARLIIEKPFGYDYGSARELNQALSQYYSESQIFRIDHYLAKEAIQNILVFRFANSLFYPVWNSRYISSIQINSTEELGVEQRGGYFDKSGILRDMVQNHIIQLLSLLTMEAPISLDAEEIRAQKIGILKSLKIHEVHRLQYEGYRQEKDIPSDSNTETYAELRMEINNFRWTGMPVYIRTGKALPRKGTEIGIIFKPLPRLLFNSEGKVKPNQIIFKIQPSEGIILDLSSKIPGYAINLQDTSMTFCYRDSFEEEIPEAYQKLLQDVLADDKTLFVSAEETEMAWKIMEPALINTEPGLYKIGETPPSPGHYPWIDFDKYSGVCL